MLGQVTIPLGRSNKCELNSLHSYTIYIVKYGFVKDRDEKKWNFVNNSRLIFQTNPVSKRRSRVKGEILFVCRSKICQVENWCRESLFDKAQIINIEQFKIRRIYKFIVPNECCLCKIIRQLKQNDKCNVLLNREENWNSFFHDVGTSSFL